MTHTRAWLSTAWGMVSKDLGLFAVLALIYLAVMWAASLVFHVGQMIIAGPATAATFSVVLHRMKTGRLDLNRLQDGLRFFVPALLAGILVSVFAGIGYLCLIVPGIIVSAFYLFPLLLIVDRETAFWDAMEQSRQTVQRDLLGFMGFVLALIGINLLGALCLGIGLLVSVPVTWCATAVAYRELWPEQGAASSST